MEDLVKKSPILIFIVILISLPGIVVGVVSNITNFSQIIGIPVNMIMWSFILVAFIGMTILAFVYHKKWQELDKRVKIAAEAHAKIEKELQQAQQAYERLQKK